MTIQVNGRVPDDIGAELDRWAAERGIERGALARDIFIEAVTARRESRASFERVELPGPDDLKRIANRLDALTTELDRVLRQSAKRDAELLKSARDDTLGVSEARSAIAADVAARMQAALELIHGELLNLREAILAALANQPQLAALLAKVNSMDADTSAKLEQIAAYAKKPRSFTKRYDIGLGQWTGGALTASFVLLMLFSVGVFFVLAAILPDRALAAPTGNRLLGGGDEAICKLVDRRYATERCKVVFGGKTVTVTARRPGTGIGRGR